MKIYTVRGNSDMEVNLGDFVETNYFYGVFSSMIEANKIANQLREHIKETGEQEEITVDELTLDEPTEDYFMAIGT